MALFDALGFFADLVAPWLDGVVAPVRYLLSPRYRRRKREEWRDSPARRRADLACGVLGLALGGVAIALFCVYLTQQ